MLSAFTYRLYVGAVHCNLQSTFAFIDDKAGIVKLGSKSGYFEAEGIKIRKGILYTGYLWGPTGNWKLTILNN